jgi:hypothetical protein
VRVRSAPGPQKNLFIKGPQTLIDRFINYTIADAYWEAFEKLLDKEQSAS